MKSKDYFILVVISLVIGFLITKINKFGTNTRIIKYQTQEETRDQVKYLKDSFSDDYYKKELESYPFDHSKIPHDGGN